MTRPSPVMRAAPRTAGTDLCRSARLRRSKSERVAMGIRLVVIAKCVLVNWRLHQPAAVARAAWARLARWPPTARARVGCAARLAERVGPGRRAALLV